MKLEISDIFDFLAAQDQDVYLVGGCIRQSLLGLKAKDFDFTVSKNAGQLAYKLSKYFKLPYFSLDKSRDMARVILDGLDLDFTPFGNSLLEDLKARDLSINALACLVTAELIHTAPASWQLIDPTGGLQDLQQGLIRGVALENFLADPLRMLRAYRFSATLDFEIDILTLEWIKNHGELIKLSAKERILQELNGIFEKNNAAIYLKDMQQQDFLQKIFKSSLDLDALATFEKMYTGRLAENFYVYLQTELAAKRPRLFVFKWATCLLEPADTLKVGTDHKRLLELTFSRKELELFSKLHQLALQFQQLQSSRQDTRVLFFHLFRNAQEDILGLLLLLQVWFRQGKIQLEPEQLNLLLLEWQNSESWVAHPPVLLNGQELMSQLSLKPGPLIGQLLLAIQEAQALGEVVNVQQALELAQALATDNGQQIIS